MDLHGRSVLLTGGGTGIGRSLALQLAQQQVRLTLVARRSGPLEEVAEQVRGASSQVHVVAADLTQTGAPAGVVAEAIERFGGLDVLINNAGNVRAGRLEQLSEQEIVAQLELNLSAPMLLTRAALPALRACGDGLVVIMSSARWRWSGCRSTPRTRLPRPASRTSRRRCVASCTGRASAY